MSRVLISGAAIAAIVLGVAGAGVILLAPIDESLASSKPAIEYAIPGQAT